MMATLSYHNYPKERTVPKKSPPNPKITVVFSPGEGDYNEGVDNQSEWGNHQ